jgi:hypothetical protein
MTQPFYLKPIARLVLSGLFTLSVLSAQAQLKISNVRVTATRTGTLEVMYDLGGNAPGDSIYLRVRGRVAGLLKPDVRYLTGDYGQNIKPGPDKKIVWRIAENGIGLDDDIRASVVAKISDDPIDRDTVATRKPGGPIFALLSLVAPGVGNIFVQSPRPKIGLRPLVTVGAYGGLIYGLLQRGQVNVPYDNYQDAKNPTDAQPFYDQANGHYQRYYIATRAAAVLTVADVVLTLVKGLRNQRAGRVVKTPAVSVHPGLQYGQPVTTLTWQF